MILSNYLRVKTDFINLYTFTEPEQLTKVNCLAEGVVQTRKYFSERFLLI